MTQRLKSCIFAAIMVAGIAGSSLVNAIMATMDNLALDSRSDSVFGTPGGPGGISTSAGVSFVALPALSQRYISPDTSPGVGDTTILSFSANQTVNYSIQVDACYEAVTGAFTVEDGGAYLMDNGTWLVAITQERNDAGPRNLRLGIGENATSLAWQNVGLVNITDGITLAASGSKIRIAFAERNVTSYHCPFWLRYFASDDFGKTWTTGILLDWVKSPGWISGLSMDATNGGVFTLVWGYANTTEGDGRSISTVWEAEHLGSAGSPWTTPENLTCFVTNNVLAFSPRITIRHATGTIYLVVNNVTTTDYVPVCFDIGMDINTANWVDYWILSGPVSASSPIVEVAVDQADGSFHFVNSTGIVGWYSASGWKGAMSTLDTFDTRSRDNPGFRLFANNGPKFFSPKVITISGTERPGILDCEPGFSFKDLAGNLSAFEVYSSIFDGKDGFGNSHGARCYSITVGVRHGVYRSDSILILGVDDSFANLHVNVSSSMISPSASPDIKDNAQFSIDSSKAGIATLFIESPANAVNTTLNMTDGLDAYSFATVCGDGRSMYMFYVRSEGITGYYVVMCKSFDGGLSWSNPKVVMSSVERILYLMAEGKGSNIYCYVKEDWASVLLFSNDGGESFVKAGLELEIDAVCADAYVSVWRGASNTTHFNLNRSLDHGYSWQPFLSIPQSGFLAEYNYLDGVAWDPVSKNYSFIITNGSVDDGTHNATFLTATSSGSAFTYWENICAGGHPGYASYAGKMDVDVRYTGTNETEWIITNSEYYRYDPLIYMAPLAFCTTSGDGAFSAWGNFTGITGRNMDALIFMWDIAFPINGNPCFVSPYVDSNQPLSGITQITLYAASTLVYSKSTNIQAGVQTQLGYVGVTNNGDLIPDGEYEWSIVFKDVVGHQVFSNGTLIIDNGIPDVEALPNYTNQTIPIPSVPVRVTIPASDLHLSAAILQYRNSTTSNWVNVTMAELIVNSTAINFSATIPANSSNEMFWRVIVSDGAGNRHIVDDNGQPFTYRLPNIRIEEESDPPESVDIGWFGTFTVTFIIPQDAEYVSFVNITYMFDDGSGVHVASMTRITESLYYYTFTSVPANATSLTYSVVAIDHFGFETVGNRSRQISVVPPLPAWSIPQESLTPVIMISMITGVFAGALYSVIIKRKAPLAKSVAEMERKTGRSNSSRNVSIALGLTVFAIVATASIGLVSIGTYDFPEGAMLAFMGTFLAAVVLWMLFAAWGITRSFERKIEKLAGSFILYVIGFSIFATLLAVIFIGNEVAWWRIRVNEQAYNIGDFAIPRMLVTLASTFFSSIILLNMSISKGVKRARKELADAEKLNMNPGWLLKKRDAEISSLMSSIGFKGLIFITIIGVTIIFASDLSTYAPQGLVIIVPFVIGTVATLAIGALMQRQMLRKKDEVIFDNLTTCPECRGSMAVGSSYCENCGKALISGTRSRIARTCSKCQGLNPEDTKRCRFCGDPLV